MCACVRRLLCATGSEPLQCGVFPPLVCLLQEQRKARRRSEQPPPPPPREQKEAGFGKRQGLEIKSTKKKKNIVMRGKWEENSSLCVSVCLCLCVSVCVCRIRRMLREEHTRTLLDTHTRALKLKLMRGRARAVVCASVRRPPYPLHHRSSPHTDTRTHRRQRAGKSEDGHRSRGKKREKDGAHSVATLDAATPPKPVGLCSAPRPPLHAQTA